MSLRRHNGGFRYDPLLYLQTRSLRQLRAMLIHIGISSAGAARLEHALALHKFAGDYFLPHAISTLAVEASGCNLAVGSFDCAVSGPFRTQHSFTVDQEIVYWYGTARNHIYLCSLSACPCRLHFLLSCSPSPSALSFPSKCGCLRRASNRWHQRWQCVGCHESPRRCVGRSIFHGTILHEYRKWQYS